MKFLAYSDLQAKEGHERLFSSPDIPLQRWRVSTFYQRMLDIYRQEDCDGVWDLGDTFDDRNAIPIPTIDAVVKGISEFPDSVWNIKLVGNHEQWTRRGDIHVGRLFSSKFNVVDGNKVFDEFDDDLDLICCAFPESDTETARWLEAEINRSKSRGRRVILLAHFQVLGCQMSSGVSLEGIPKKMIQRADMGLFGHVHSAQELCPNIFYLGSPFQQDFGEANEEKRVAIIDTDAFTIKWIRVDGFPQYRTVSLADFEKNVDESSEDRLKVVLKNPAEAERFYAHHLSHRVVEPIYDYQAGVEQDSTLDAFREQHWTLDSVLMRYMARTGPGARNIQLSAEEMFEYGKQIAEATAD